MFVDLRAVYPTPEVPGTEMSFEEIWALRRGWLDRSWEDAVSEEEEVEDLSSEVDMLSLAVEDKLVVHRDVAEKLVVLHDVAEKPIARQDVVMLDENGAPIYHREGKPRKKKVIEVNETQISKCCISIWPPDMS